MVKRIAAVPLWFLSGWLMYGLLAYFTGLPEIGGAIVGALAAAFVLMDPTGAFWHHENRRPATDRNPASQFRLDTPSR